MLSAKSGYNEDDKIVEANLRALIEKIVIAYIQDKRTD